MASDPSVSSPGEVPGAGRAADAATPPAGLAAPAPQRWTGRARVAGARPSGPKATDSTDDLGVLLGQPGILVWAWSARRRRRLVRRLVTGLVALILVVAVPVVSAYVAYKLALGENPLEWPPTVDYDKFFG